ncbi:2Fe-2S iron-sulfur cluster-binding protein [Pseudomonas sp. LB3P14]
MPIITYIEHNGTAHEVNVANGDSLMQGAVNNAIPGIDADCGGACACATCHIYIEEPWTGQLNSADAMEQAMLECVQELRPGSRLACQVCVNDAHDGMHVAMPQHQGM